MACTCVYGIYILDADFTFLSAGYESGEVQQNCCQQQEQVNHAKAAVAVMYTQRA